MNVLPVAIWTIVVVIVEGKTKDSEVDHADVDSIDLANYTTSEMRDRILAEWKGRTDEVQGYFDQLPSEEFKENSEDLKFKYYYERKGLRNVDRHQVLNITPQEFREPPGPEYTIEVNDSYVPKYRITTSEEERMDKYGTFNSESDSSEVSKEEVKKKRKKKKKKDSSESGSEKPKKKKEKKKYPSNMDPTEKRRKKKSRTSEEEKKRENLEKELLGKNEIRLNFKKVKDDRLQDQNQHNSKIVQGIHKVDKVEKTKQFSRKVSDKVYLKSKNVDKDVRKNRQKTLNNEDIESKLEHLEKQRQRLRKQRKQFNGFPLRPLL